MAIQRKAFNGSTIQEAVKPNEPAVEKQEEPAVSNAVSSTTSGSGLQRRSFSDNSVVSGPTDVGSGLSFLDRQKLTFKGAGEDWIGGKLQTVSYLTGASTRDPEGYQRAYEDYLNNYQVTDDMGNPIAGAELPDQAKMDVLENLARTIEEKKPYDIALKNYANKMSDSAQQDLTKAQEGTKGLGNMLLKAEASSIESGLDAISNALMFGVDTSGIKSAFKSGSAGEIAKSMLTLAQRTKNHSYAGFAARAFGNTIYNDQKNNEARIAQGLEPISDRNIVLHGVASTLIEVMTEEMSNIAPLQKTAYGTGSLDSILEDVVNNAVEKYASTPAGREALSMALTGATSFFSEGLEEFVGDWAEYITNIGSLVGEERGTVPEQLMQSVEDFIVGGLSGLMGAGGQMVSNSVVKGIQSYQDAEAGTVFNKGMQSEDQDISNFYNAAYQKAVEEGRLADEGTWANYLSKQAENGALDNTNTGKLLRSVDEEKSKRFVATSQVNDAIKSAAAGEEISRDTLDEIIANDAAMNMLKTQGGMKLDSVSTMSQKRKAVFDALTNLAKSGTTLQSTINSSGDIVSDQNIERKQASNAMNDYADKRFGQAGATVMKQVYNDGQDTAQYMDAMTRVYDLGRNGQELTDEDIPAGISAAQAEAMYKAGQSDGNINPSEVKAAAEAESEAQGGIRNEEGREQSGSSSSERNDNVRGEGSAAGVSEGTESSQTERSGSNSQSEQSGKRNNGRVRQVQKQSEVVRGGSSKVGMEVASEAQINADPRLRALKDHTDKETERLSKKFGINKKIETVFTFDKIVMENGQEVQGVYMENFADGVDRIVVSLSSRRDAKRLWNHEFTHALIKNVPGLRAALMKTVVDNFPQDKFGSMVTAYANSQSGATQEERKEKAIDEILCDAVAGINRFDYMKFGKGAEQFSQKVNEAVRSFEKGSAETSDKAETSNNFSGELFTKSFAYQVLNLNKIPSGDQLLVGGTPQVLLDIGLASLPVTFNRTHAKYLLNGKPGDTSLDHRFSIQTIQSIPEKMKSPIAIIATKAVNKKEYAVTELIELTSLSGNNVIVPIYVDSRAHINALDVNVNAISTIFGKNNIVNNTLNKAFTEYSNGFGTVFYLDNKKIQALPNWQGLQLPKSLQKINGFVSSINDPNSVVKQKLNDVKQSIQFNRYMQDSKAVDDNGKAKLYYATSKDKLHFTDTKKAGEGYYLSAINPIGSKYYYENDPKSKKLKDALKKRTDITSGEIDRILQDSNWYERLNKIVPGVERIAKNAGFDSIYNDATGEWTIFKDSQRKSERSIGLFSKDTSNDMFSSELDSNGNALSQQQAEYFKDSKERDENGNLRVMYRGGNEDISVFDRKKSKPSNLYGRGFYFTAEESHAKQYGNAIPYYLDIQNPLGEERNITRAQMRKFLKAVAENEDYGLDNYGYGATVDSVLNDLFKGNKSDFVKIQDVSATAIGDLVAAAELFNEVNGTNYDGFILPTESVVFRSEQIKKIDNLNPTSDQNVNFSMELPVEETKDLIAVHNLTEQNLRDSLKLGGLPMPSIAVVKSRDGHTNFGPISFIFRKDTIDPDVDADNHVYGSDAYTPTAPQIDYEANKDVSDKIEDKFYTLEKKFGRNVADPLYGLAYDLERKLENNKGEKGLIDSFADDTKMMNVFLADTTGAPVEDVSSKKVDRMSDMDIETAEYILGKLDETKLLDLKYSKGFDFMRENKEYIKDVYKQMLMDLDGLTLEEAEAEVNRLTPIALWKASFSKALRYEKHGPETVTVEYDGTATRQKILDSVDQAEYQKWLNDLITGATASIGIYNGKDFYTRDGSRRSFKETHYPLTLKNIVKVMRGGRACEIFSVNRSPVVD